MAVSPATIRQRAATALEALPDWSEVPYPYGLYEARKVPEVRSLGFAVGIPETVPDTSDTRQRMRPSRNAAAWVVSQIVVVWYYRLRTEGEVDDYDAAIAAEMDALAALRGMSREDMSIPHIDRIERAVEQVDSLAHMRTEVRATVRHVYTLS